MEIDKLKEVCRPYLSSIHRSGLFIFYTIHDESHSNIVWEISKKIANGKLSDREMDLMEASCWIHDIGLSKWKKEDIYLFDNNEYCNFVRKFHHKRSESFINNFYVDLGLTKHQAQVIGRIVYAHSSKADVNDLNSIDYIEFNGKEEKIRTKLIASILRVSDSLDARKDRVPPEGYTQEAPFESKIEYLKHVLVNKIDINSDKIIIEIYEDKLSKELKNKFLEELNSVKQNLTKSKLASQIKFIDINQEIGGSALENEFIPGDIKRTTEIYVKPPNFEDILKKLEKYNLVIITGDASVGKTSTANYLAYILNQKREMPIISINSEQNIKSFNDCIIILDDAFGESKFKDKNYISPDIISKLKEKNYVIITTRKQVLIDANNETKLGEYDFNNCTIELGQEGSYNNDFLKKILKNHLNFYKKEGKITDKEIEIAKQNENLIVENLRFPHNIDLFVKEKLLEITDGKQIEDAIEESKWIKRVAKNWFMNLDDTRKFFVFTVWLFPIDKSILKRVYLKIVEIFRKRKPELETGDLNDLIERTNSYIAEYDFNRSKTYLNRRAILEELILHEQIDPYFLKFPHKIKDKFLINKIEFRHPNYREGITNAIENNFSDFLQDLIPLFCDLVDDEKIRDSLIDATRRIANVHPDKTKKILLKISEDPNPNTKRFLALTLGDIGKKNSEMAVEILEKLYYDKIPIEEPKHFLLGVSSVKEAVLLSLANIGSNYPNKVFFLLKKISKTGNRSIKESLIRTLVTIAKTNLNSVIEILEDLSDDKDPYIRKYLVKALNKIEKKNPTKTIHILKKLSDDEEWEVREVLVEVLADIGQYESDISLEILEKLSNDDEEIVRAYIPSTLTKLEEYDSDKVFKLLEKLSEDDYSVVRSQVLLSLERIGKSKPTKVIKLLEKMSNEDKWEVQAYLISALGVVGEVHPELVIKMLEKLSNDKSLYVKVHTNHVLRKIK